MLSFPSETENGCLLNDGRGEREEGQKERKRKAWRERETKPDATAARAARRHFRSRAGKGLPGSEFPMATTGILGALMLDELI